MSNHLTFSFFFSMKQQQEERNRVYFNLKNFLLLKNNSLLYLSGTRRRFMIQTKAKTYSFILIGRVSIKYFDYLYTAMFSIKTQRSIPEFDLYFCQVKLYLYFDLKKKMKRWIEIPKFVMKRVFMRSSKI